MAKQCDEYDDLLLLRLPPGTWELPWGRGTQHKPLVTGYRALSPTGHMTGSLLPHGGPVCSSMSHPNSDCQLWLDVPRSRQRSGTWSDGVLRDSTLAVV